jgi:hypothetical protein
VETSKDVKTESCSKVSNDNGSDIRPLLKLAAKWIIEDSNRRRIKENKAALMSVAAENKVKKFMISIFYFIFYSMFICFPFGFV